MEDQFVVGIPLRDFGRTGVKVSALACGGHHLGDPDEESVARQIVNRSIDGGITFFDNCPRQSARHEDARTVAASAADRPPGSLAGATNFPFDAVQMPLNPFDATFEFRFERLVLPELNCRGIAVLGMKPMGGTAESVKKGLVGADGVAAIRHELARYNYHCGHGKTRNLRASPPPSPGTSNR